MVEFDSEALRAAAESARQKSALGSSATDQLAAGSYVVADDGRRERPADLRTRYMGLWLRNPVVAPPGRSARRWTASRRWPRPASAPL